MDRFRLLTGGPRTATSRQRTLRASVDWSHKLLSPDEQVLLRRIGVFAGGFTLDAVKRICVGDGVEPDRVLDLLASLVDQSLVIAEERTSGMRYRLLETVREYALEQLADAGEEEALRRRHRDFFLALAEEAAPHLDTGRQREWLEILDPEAANLAAAIEYALASEPPLALRFCARCVDGGSHAGASRRRSWPFRAPCRLREDDPRCGRECSNAAPSRASGRPRTKPWKHTPRRRWRWPRTRGTRRRPRGLTSTWAR